MNEETLQLRAERLKGLAAMGGFEVTLDQAKQAVVEADEEDRIGDSPTLAQTLAQIQQENRFSSATE